MVLLLLLHPWNLHPQTREEPGETSLMEADPSQPEQGLQPLGAKLRGGPGEQAAEFRAWGSLLLWHLFP